MRITVDYSLSENLLPVCSALCCIVYLWSNAEAQHAHCRAASTTIAQLFRKV